MEGFRWKRQRFWLLAEAFDKLLTVKIAAETSQGESRGGCRAKEQPD